MFYKQVKLKRRSNFRDAEVKSPKMLKKNVQKDLKAKNVDHLKFSVVQDGMLVLGIVSQVTVKIVTVSLPGEVRGIIEIGQVSEFYKSLVESANSASEVPSLSDVIKVGDVIPVKIISVPDSNPLILTSDPKAVNQNLSYSVMEKGFILLGSVNSKEDHGYIIDFGIENVKGFLHFDKTDKGKDLNTGQLVRCAIIKCSKSVGVCSVQLSMLKSDIESAVISEDSSLPVYCFVPGFQFKIKYTQAIIEGFEISLNKPNTPKAYIHEDHLLKKFPNVNNIKIGSQAVGTLLYIKPLVNFLYFKIMPSKPVTWPFEYGEIVRGKVVTARASGIVFKVFDDTRKAKCFVPFSKLKHIGKFDSKDEILNLYHVNKSISKIRLGHRDYMNRFYLGAMDKDSIEEKYFSVTDIKCGEILTGEIIAFQTSLARIRISKYITGVVQFTDMTDVPLTNPTSKFKVGDKVKARVLEVHPDNKFVRLTMKPALIKEKNILSNLEDVKKNACYTGEIVSIQPNRLIVKFFNDIGGTVPQHLTPYPASPLTQNYQVGQLVKCSIVSWNKKNYLTLSLAYNDSSVDIEVGKRYEAVAVSKTKTDVIIEIELDGSKKCKGYLPAVLLTPHKSLVASFFGVVSEGDAFSVFCVVKNDTSEWPVFASADIFDSFYEENSEEELHKKLTKDSVLPFLYNSRCHKTNKNFLINLIPETTNLPVTVIQEDTFDANKFVKYQLVYGKILSVNPKFIKVSTKVSDVWDKDYEKSLELLDSYLKTMSSIIAQQKVSEAYSQDLRLGCSVKGTIEEVRSKHAVVRTESGDLGLAEGKFTVGEQVSGKVAWIDTNEQMIHLYVRKKPMPEKNDPASPKRKFVPGKIVFVSEEAVVVVLKNGTGELAFMPRRRHVNDFVVPECLLEAGENLFVFVTKKESDYNLAIDKRVVRLQEKIAWNTTEAKLKNSVKSLKSKLAEEKNPKEKSKKMKKNANADDVEVVDVKLSSKTSTDGVVNGDTEELKIKEEIDSDDETFKGLGDDVPRLEYDDVDIKSENEDDKEKEKPGCKTTNEEKILLSSSSESEDEEEVEAGMTTNKAFKVGFNWDVLNNYSLLSGVTMKKKESSDDEEDEAGVRKKKKIILSASERKEKAKSEEERIRQIEELLMDPNREPETADDFDRAVLANPDSSALWLKYMAFHIQGTEIEKARAVARRALKAIPFREEQEKLNIWIALLNLENMYGNEDSLNKTLGEALQFNDPYKIHLHMLNMYGQGNKFQEMEKLGNFILKKYKDVESMWYGVAAAYFSFGKVESGRNIMQRALKVLAKNQHVLLISKFAQMENKYGNHERAQTLYESILASFPKRVDIWSVYVDMLVKSSHIDLARQVLERATSQNLRPRKMKSLFKKFIAFEETHGTPENVEKVREAAVEYVQTVGGMDD